MTPGLWYNTIYGISKRPADSRPGGMLLVQKKDRGGKV